MNDQSTMNDKSQNQWGILGIFSLIFGVAAWFAGGLIAIVIGLIAIAFGFFGIKRQQKLSQLGMIIATVPIIYINIMNLEAVPVPSALESDRSYLIKSINGSISVFNMLGKGAHTETEKDRFIEECRDTLDKAQKVDPMVIEKQVPGFSDHYKNEFMKGMEDLIQGYENSDIKMKIQGGLLLDKWALWQRKNREAFNGIKEPEYSLITFLKGIIGG